MRARVVATFGRNLLVEDERGVIVPAVRRGKRGDAVVGDFVHIEPTSDSQAIVESIEPRTTLLYRADAFKTKELAANVDQVVIVFASRPAFNLHFIWKALVAASTAGIDAMVVRNKIDLTEGAAEAVEVVDELSALGFRTLSISSRDTEATRVILDRELGGRKTLLIGQSGMGKSTLLNLMVPAAQARTQEFSQRLNLGKQTTTSSRWFSLPQGGALVDTPGFQEFGLDHLDQAQIAETFPEFERALAEQSCRFLDCRHLEEPDCSVRTAVQSGEIAPARYAFYRALVGSKDR